MNHFYFIVRTESPLPNPNFDKTFIVFASSEEKAVRKLMNYFNNEDPIGLKKYQSLQGFGEFKGMPPAFYRHAYPDFILISSKKGLERFSTEKFKKYFSEYVYKEIKTSSDSEINFQNFKDNRIPDFIYEEFEIEGDRLCVNPFYIDDNPEEYLNDDETNDLEIFDKEFDEISDLGY